MQYRGKYLANEILKELMEAGLINDYVVIEYPDEIYISIQAQKKGCFGYICVNRKKGSGIRHKCR